MRIQLLASAFSALLFNPQLSVLAISYPLDIKPCEDLFNYRFLVVQSLKTFYIRRLSAWSGGGGPVWNLENSTGSPFEWRTYGSGDRHTIYGSRAYGSGYPQRSYPVANSSTIAGRGFPYGVWPIPWASDYAGGGEYGTESAELFRPGGMMVQVPLQTSSDKWKISSVEDETYWLIGDRESTLSIMASMVDWCHAKPIWPELFTPANDTVGVAKTTTGQGARFHPGNVVQYYRASSFAIVHPKYNNTYAYAPYNTSTLLTHDQSSPLTDTMIYSPWLRCINATIANALPILDKPPPKELTGGIIAAIVLSTFFGPCVLGLLCQLLMYLCLCGARPRRPRRTKDRSIR